MTHLCTNPSRWTGSLSSPATTQSAASIQPATGLSARTHVPSAFGVPSNSIFRSMQPFSCASCDAATLTDVVVVGPVLHRAPPFLRWLLGMLVRWRGRLPGWCGRRWRWRGGRLRRRRRRRRRHGRWRRRGAAGPLQSAQAQQCLGQVRRPLIGHAVRQRRELGAECRVLGEGASDLGYACSGLRVVESRAGRQSCVARQLVVRQAVQEIDDIGNIRLARHP